MKINGAICTKCNVLVYPRALYDSVSCFCKNISIAKNSEKTETITAISEEYKKVRLDIPLSAKELYDDFNEEQDLLGTIPLEKVVEKDLLDKIIVGSKEAMLYNLRKGYLGVSEFFKQQYYQLLEKKARQNARFVK